ncbi:hypothetical protein [Yoonia sp. BS5-3]|uniref:Uncharacterized protein n=1 Tax=Yoonia phaeophyticola TaxID=3137369 RepID=A0ABZ2V4C1_9RHOB
MIDYNQNQVVSLSQIFWDKLPMAIAAVVMLALVWAASRSSAWHISRSAMCFKLRAFLIDALSPITSVAVWIGGILTTLGPGAVAIGLAFKDTGEKLVTGIEIPFPNQRLAVAKPIPVKSIGAT